MLLCLHEGASIHVVDAGCVLASYTGCDVKEQTIQTSSRFVSIIGCGFDFEHDDQLVALVTLHHFPSSITLPSSSTGSGKIPNYQLRQTDFDEGSVIITAPGKYKLMEDISFNPNPAPTDIDAQTKEALATSSMPTAAFLDSMDNLGLRKSFALGFFAAIVIMSDKVTINLNGKTLEQSEEHALAQRFYAHIELASSPFIPAGAGSQGPANFGNQLLAATNVTIRNGVLGRTSHHCIHGNGMEGVKIIDVQCKDFEVTGMQFNGGKRIELKGVEVGPARTDVPVLGIFSHAKFIRPYVEAILANPAPECSAAALPIHSHIVNGQTVNTPKPGVDILDDLDSAIFETFMSVVKKDEHVAIPQLFQNPSGITDANQHGLIFAKIGAAVNGFAKARDVEAGNSGILLKNVHVHDLISNVREVVMFDDGTETGTPQHDPVGAALDIEFAMDSDNVYKANVVANAQVFVAANSHCLNQDPSSPDFSDFTRNKITQETVNWVAQGNPYTDDFVCNGDIMFHVQRGNVGIRLDGAHDVKIKTSSVFNVNNTGLSGSTRCGNYLYDKSHKGAALLGYLGAASRGISIAGSTDIAFKGYANVVNGIHSDYGTACGVDVFTESREVSGHVSVGHCAVNEATIVDPSVWPTHSQELPKGIPAIFGPETQELDLTIITLNDLEVQEAIEDRPY